MKSHPRSSALPTWSAPLFHLEHLFCRYCPYSYCQKDSIGKNLPVKYITNTAVYLFNVTAKTHQCFLLIMSRCHSPPLLFLILHPTLPPFSERGSEKEMFIMVKCPRAQLHNHVGAKVFPLLPEKEMGPFLALCVTQSRLESGSIQGINIYIHLID